MNVLVNADEVAQKITNKIRNSEQHSGLKTGFANLDECLMGFRPGDLVVLSGVASSGKTAFSLSLARRLALESNIGVLVFSPTKSADYIVSRLLAAETINGTTCDIRHLTADSRHMAAVQDAEQKLKDAPIKIYDQVSVSLSEIDSIASGQKEEIGLVIVDEATDVKPERADEDGSDIFGALKNIAERLELPILAVTQLENVLGGRVDHRPDIAGLNRDSVAIADSVLMAYCPSMYGLKSSDGSDLDGLLEIEIVKNRYNSLGSIFLHLDPMTSDCRGLA
jgi:replicative DNA helicase